MIKFWGLSAVLRIPVAGRDNLRRDVYFKATCRLFHAEPAITELLATSSPITCRTCSPWTAGGLSCSWVRCLVRIRTLAAGLTSPRQPAG
jgi:hypothetical protein